MHKPPIAEDLRRSAVRPSAFDAWPGHAGNWGRWPNERGTLNLIDPHSVMRGVRSARDGIVVPCARPMVPAEPLKPSTRLYEHQMEHVHDMTDVGVNKTQATQDSVKFWIHNLINTHIDALSHVGYAGYGFNGHRFNDIVSVAHGATIQDVSCLMGVVTRAHLIDVARGRGAETLPAGSLVHPEDLSAHLGEVEPGDAVLIRTGATITGGRPVEDPALDRTFGRGTWSGLHPDSIELLASKDISIIGGDAIEPFPSPVPAQSGVSIHVLCLTLYGIHIVHHMDLEQLARHCAEKKRSSFLFMVSALNIPGATGCPVTPVAVL